MKVKQVLYPLLFAVFSFAAIFMVARLNPGFDFFTRLYLELPLQFWFGGTELFYRAVYFVLEVLALASLATAFLVLFARDNKPIVVSAIAGSVALLSGVLFFGFYTYTLLFALGVFLGVLFFAGGSGGALGKGERLSAGGKLVTAFFFINLFVALGTYLSFSENSAAYGGVVFEKVVDNALVMASTMSTGLGQGMQAQLEGNLKTLLDAQRATVDATAYGMNQYLIAQGQQPVPASVVSALKDQIADEARLREQLGKADLSAGLGINRDMVKGILEPLIGSQLTALFPVASAFLVFFLLEFFSNGLKLLVPLFVVVLAEIEKLAEKKKK